MSTSFPKIIDVFTFSWRSTNNINLFQKRSLKKHRYLMKQCFYYLNKNNKTIFENSDSSILFPISPIFCNIRQRNQLQLKVTGPPGISSYKMKTIDNARLQCCPKIKPHKKIHVCWSLVERCSATGKFWQFKVFGPF